MNGQVRRLPIRGALGSYSLLVYQMAEDGNPRELGAHWVSGMGFCVGHRGLSLARVRAKTIA